jgi:hypothetical protein
MNSTTIKTFLALALATTLASCADKEEVLDPSLHGFFPDDSSETRKPFQFADAQAAAGARADAMLYKQHFDGPRLNSLGEAKLADMLKDDDAPTPMTVYLKLDEAAASSKARQQSVVTYLKDLGLAESQITIVYGDNPAARNPIAPGMKNYTKTDTGSGGVNGGSSTSGGGSNDANNGGGNTGGGGGGGGGNDGGSTKAAFRD